MSDDEIEETEVPRVLEGALATAEGRARGPDRRAASPGRGAGSRAGCVAGGGAGRGGGAAALAGVGRSWSGRSPRRSVPPLALPACWPPSPGTGTTRPPSPPSRSPSPPCPRALPSTGGPSTTRGGWSCCSMWRGCPGARLRRHLHHRRGPGGRRRVPVGRCTDDLSVQRHRAARCGAVRRGRRPADRRGRPARHPRLTDRRYRLRRGVGAARPT